jgi:hypothetical protein
MKYLCILILTFLSISAGLSSAENPAAKLVWKIDFEKDKPGMPPGITAQSKSAMNEMAKKGQTVPLPLTGFSVLDYVLPTRTAIVKEKPCGMQSRACVLKVAPEDPGREVGHSRGPRLIIDVPPSAKTSKRLKLSFDIAAGKIMQMGTLSCWAGSRPIFTVAFYNDGLVRMDVRGGKADLCRYFPGKPIHLEFIIDNFLQQVTPFLKSDGEPLFTAPWTTPPDWSATFTQFIVMGMSTGPHSSKGWYAIDDIRLEMIE